MNDLFELGTRAGALLRRRGETVAVAETSAAGLVSASLLAVPGASHFYVGGAVPYSFPAILALLDLDLRGLMKQGIRSSSEPYAKLLAQTVREKHAPKAVWGLSETGAAGPDGNRYGDPAGHSCMAVDGPVLRVRTLRTGSADRVQNMQAFARATLELLIEALEAAPPVVA